MTTEAENKDTKVDEVIEDNKEQVQSEGDGVVELSPEEQRAAGYGWKPKDKWVEEGHAEDEWVPAKHFLKFGEVKSQAIAKDKQLAKQERIIRLMKTHHLSVREAAYKEAAAALKAERQAALADNDLVKAEHIKDKLEEAKEQFARSAQLPAEIENEIQQVQQVVDQQPDPAFAVFQEKNPWYVVGGKDEMSKEADKLGFAEVQAARAEGRNITASDVYKAVETKIRKLFPEKFATPKSPQSESPGRSSGKTGSSVKLSPEQLEIAKAFNLSPEKYAEELKSYKGR